MQAEKFNIQIEVQYPENKIGKLFVDSEKIAWVLTNLLSNAIRYSPENGRIIIGARQTDDNYIEMYVRDFGKGIDPRYHQSILIIISEYLVQRFKVVDWDYQFRRIL